MPEENENTGVGEFLNPKSMLTPGICGAVIMVTANTLGAAFGLEGPVRSLICLALSFLAGTLVFAAGVRKFWRKLAYYIFNSLIIFSTAAGVNFSGQKALGDATSNTTEGTNTVVFVTNSIVVVQYVTNGMPLKPVTKPTFKPTTNQVPIAMKGAKASTKFIQSWR